VQRALPFADDLRQAITQARPRPVSPVYTQISQAIYENAHDALTGQATPDAAASAMNQEIQRALETF
jgi:multiple sugar transport system substrate-binding protein